MGLSEEDVARVRTAAALHDVGKLHTPREILNKPGRLTDEEFAVVRRHPGDGATMATGLDDPMITAMIRHHHERLDGAATRRASPATRSRSARASSPSRTPSTR